MNFRKSVVFIMVFLVIMIASTLVFAESFKDSFQNYIGAELEIYVKHCSGNVILILCGNLIEVQDDYIKIVRTQLESGKTALIKIEDISAYTVIKLPKTK